MREDDVGVDGISGVVEFVIDESDFLLLVWVEMLLFVFLRCRVVGVILGLLGTPGGGASTVVFMLGWVLVRVGWF